MRVQGSATWESGFRVQGLGSGGWGLEYRVEGLGFGIGGLSSLGFHGLRFRGTGFRVAC